MSFRPLVLYLVASFYVGAAWFHMAHYNNELLNWSINQLNPQSEISSLSLSEAKALVQKAAKTARFHYLDSKTKICVTELCQFGDPYAEYLMGMLIAYSQFGIENCPQYSIYDIDHQNSLKWFESAARKGVAEAYDELGNYYFYKDANELKAKVCFQNAIDRGCVVANIDMGRLYDCGSSKAYAQAMTYYERAVFCADASTANWAIQHVIKLWDLKQAIPSERFRGKDLTAHDFVLRYGTSEQAEHVNYIYEYFGCTPSFVPFDLLENIRMNLGENTCKNLGEK